jgi:PqqD family protein of HPr-rel-A system
MSDIAAPAARDLEYRTAGTDVVVHDPVSARVHVLNPTAAYILQACDGTRSPDEIAHALSAGTGAPHAQTLPDVERTIAELRALELVH